MGALRKLPTGPRGGPTSGKADRRDVGGKVRHSEWFGHAGQVIEELNAAWQSDEHLVLLLRDAGGDERLQPPGLVDDDEASPAGPGQRARPVHDPLQHGIEVEVFADAEAGLAQPGEAVPQGLVLSQEIVGVHQRLTSFGLCSSLDPVSSVVGWMGRGGLDRVRPVSGKLYQFRRTVTTCHRKQG